MIQVAQFVWNAIVDYIKSLLLYYFMSITFQYNTEHSNWLLGHLLPNVKSLLDVLRSASDLQRYLLVGFL